MAICRRIGTVVFVFGAIASVVILFGVGGAAARSIGGKGTAPAALVSSGQAFASCPSGYFCDYIYDNGYGVCFKVNPFRATRARSETCSTTTSIAEAGPTTWS